VSLLGLLSPVVATFTGWLVLDQTLTRVQLLGVLLVGTALVVGQRTPNRGAAVPLVRLQELIADPDRAAA
jgi:probable blue pigment (indigoidine) exporter